MNRTLLCSCDCLDLLLLSHDGLGHALSEVKHGDPVLTLLSRLDSVCTPSMYKPGSPCHRPRSIRVTLLVTSGPVCSASDGHPASPHVSTPTSGGRFFSDVCSSSSCSSSSSKSKMVCLSTSLGKFSNSLARHASLEHGHVAGLAIRCRLLGGVGTSTLLRRTTAPTGTLNVSNMIRVMRSGKTVFWICNPESVEEYVMPDFPSYWSIPTIVPGI